MMSNVSNCYPINGLMTELSHDFIDTVVWVKIMKFFPNPARLSSISPWLIWCYRGAIDKTFKTRSKKQENINEILKAEGLYHRIGNIEVKIGVPPKMIYDLKSWQMSKDTDQGCFDHYQGRWSLVRLLAYTIAKTGFHASHSLTGSYPISMMGYVSGLTVYWISYPNISYLEDNEHE